MVESRARVPVRIPLSVPWIGSDEERSVAEALAEGWVSTAGPYVGRFEAAIRDVVGAKHAVATVNGTAALHLACVLAELGPGDAVIVPPLTFIGSVNPIRYCGAVPIFSDVRAQDGNLDVAIVEEYLQRGTRRTAAAVIDKRSGARVRAIMAVHLFGAPANVERLRALASEYDITLLEDAAEALGSRYQGTHVGRFGTIGCLSFNGNKVVTTGGGGMVVTDDDTVAARARHLSTQARVDPSEYRHDQIGFNYRLTSLQAALGLAQIRSLDERLSRKRAFAAEYRKRLAGLPVRFLEPAGNTESNYWLTAVVFQDARTRDIVIERLRDDGIEARAFFVPLHELAPYRDALRTGPLVVAEGLHIGGVNLPSSPGMTVAEVSEVANVIRAALSS